MTRDGKPDTHNVACMKDCAKEVRLSSEMPDYARDQHGNLAEQTRQLGPFAAGPTPPPPQLPPPATTREAADIAKASACMACHGAAEKIVGPGFREVAARYAGDAGAEAQAGRQGQGRVASARGAASRCRRSRR